MLGIFRKNEEQTFWKVMKKVKTRTRANNHHLKELQGKQCPQGWGISVLNKGMKNLQRVEHKK